MVKRAIIKAGAKLLKKAKPKGMLKAKPKSAAMIARRNILRGDGPRMKVMGGIRESMKDPSKQLKRLKKPSTKASYIEGALTGSAATAATYTYLKSKKAKEAKAKETKAKLKKSIEKKREEDKKKKDAYGKRAPKKDKYYGGR